MVHECNEDNMVDDSSRYGILDDSQEVNMVDERSKYSMV